MATDVWELWDDVILSCWVTESLLKDFFYYNRPYNVVVESEAFCQGRGKRRRLKALRKFM